MGKKHKVQKPNVATDTNTAKNPDPTPETPINGLENNVTEVVVSTKPSSHKSSVRRSGRLQSVIKPVQFQVVEQIDLVESEKEDIVEQPSSIVAEPCNQDLGNGPTPKNIGDERVDHLDVNESTSVGLIYKSLYLDSQKKIEALTSENHDLSSKLQIVLAKLEVYENINKSTQAAIVSNLEKAIETLVRPTSHFGGGHADEVPIKESAKKRRSDHVV
ncbi:hypothetical protein LXL04_001055 [Taraxacum kok-saghyz]